jgi:hypothetical protein
VAKQAKAKRTGKRRGAATKRRGTARTSRAPGVAKRFKVGDHVTWNSEAGQVSGRIIRVHTKDVMRKGYTRHASEESPQYEIKSDKTDHVAMHKGTALKLMRR